MKIKQYPGYRVTTDGRVHSVDRYVVDSIGRRRFFPGKLLTAKTDTSGYRTVRLSGKDVRIHRLVAQAFIPNPDNKPEVNHKDGNKANNHKDNLEWATRMENMQHAVRTGLQRIGEAAPHSKLTDAEIAWIRATGYNNKQCALVLNVTPQYIGQVRRGVRR